MTKRNQKILAYFLIGLGLIYLSAKLHQYRRRRPVLAPGNDPGRPFC